MWYCRIYYLPVAWNPILIFQRRDGDFSLLLFLVKEQPYTLLESRFFTSVSLGKFMNSYKHPVFCSGRRRSETCLTNLSVYIIQNISQRDIKYCLELVPKILYIFFKQLSNNIASRCIIMFAIISLSCHCSTNER